MVKESILKRLQKASVFVMADITAVEELSVFCRWEEGGSWIFLDIVLLKKTDAESIYLH